MKVREYCGHKNDCRISSYKSGEDSIRILKKVREMSNRFRFNEGIKITNNVVSTVLNPGLFRNRTTDLSG